MRSDPRTPARAIAPCALLTLIAVLVPLSARAADGFNGTSFGASVPPPASAQLALELAAQLHAQGCGGHPGVRALLREPPTLRAAAGRWAAGAPLEVAIDATGYRAERSEALQYRGSASGLRSALLQRLCRALTEPEFRDIGIWGQGEEIWLLLATPFQAPDPANAAPVINALLREINVARSKPRHCGSRAYPAAPALQFDGRLNQAAARHARDMLVRDFFDHVGSDGSTPATRVLQAGYRFHLVGENIAEGAESTQEAVRGWLASPGHCENIMDAAFRETGFAFSVTARGAPRIYWVEDFAAPLR